MSIVEILGGLFVLAAVVGLILAGAELLADDDEDWN